MIIWSSLEYITSEEDTNENKFRNARIKKTANRFFIFPLLFKRGDGNF